MFALFQSLGIFPSFKELLVISHIGFLHFFSAFFWYAAIHFIRSHRLSNTQLLQQFLHRFSLYLCINFLLPLLLPIHWYYMSYLFSRHGLETLIHYFNHLLNDFISFTFSFELFDVISILCFSIYISLKVFGFLRALLDYISFKFSFFFYSYFNIFASRCLAFFSIN